MMHQDSGSLLFGALSFFCLLGLFFLGALSQLFIRHRKRVCDEFLSTSHPLTFLKLQRMLCRDGSPEAFSFCLFCSQYILGSLYVVFFCTVLLGAVPLPLYLKSYAWLNGFEILKLGSFLFVLFSTYMVFGDILPRSWAYHSPTSLLRFAIRPAGGVLLLLSPILLTICRLVKLAAPHTTFSSFGEPKEQLADFLSGGTVNEHDKRLLLSVVNFKNRIVREIMQPRVDLFCISEDLTLQEAAELLHKEGYSRVPLYRGTVDTVVGVLFYKDFLAKYVEATESGVERERMLSTPVKSLMKKVLYCPETKKISSLLQEFRKRQTHLAVVVDEYGGTAGLVTIEDILEEIVGEIADEYDEQESLFKPAPGEGWIVDAKMNLLDIQEELGLVIPQEETYDTLAGYIVYRVGSIPQAGLILHHDQFNIEILKSNDRMVEEVKITPLFPSAPSDKHSEQAPS